MHEKGIHRGVRAVALFEALKGVLALMVLLAGVGVFSLLHWRVRDLAGHVVELLHLDPRGDFSTSLLRASSRVGNGDLQWAAVFILVYAGVRLFEAYGLWRKRTWAEWLALVSGAVYLPFEIYELAVKVTWVRVGVLAINLGIVWLMALVLIAARRNRPALRRQV